MLLTKRALFLLLLDALLLAGATTQPLLLYFSVAYLALILVMVLADRHLTPAPREFELARMNESRLSLGAENLVLVRVTNRGRRAVRALVRDEFPVQFRADAIFLGQAQNSHQDTKPQSKKNKFLRAFVPSRLGGARSSEVESVTLNPRETIELRYHIRPPRRGAYAFGDLNLRWWGVLGLIVRQARYPAVAPVKVYPNLLDIRKYELLARKGQLTEMGLRHMRMLGSGTEFERLREYQLDDEFRKIDWKATARRGKPVSREFETERSQTIMSLLDVGRLMRPPVGDPSTDAKDTAQWNAPLENTGQARQVGQTGAGQVLAKLDYAVNAVLMLSYVAGLRGDKVGLLAFADDVTHYLAPRGGRGQFYRMLAILYGVESEPIEANYARAFAYLGAKHKKRSLIVIFTDLASGLAAESILAQVAPLWPRHLPLLVAISDPSVVELALQTPTDSPTVYQRVVAEQMLNERALILESLRQRGVLTLDVPANQLTIAVVNKYLELKARGRI